MDILKGGFTDRQVESILGESLKRGSTRYFIQTFDATNTKDANPFEGHKCILEEYQKGLLIRTFKSDKRMALSIKFDEIESLKLTKGYEDINPYFLSPMWLLLKLNTPVIRARYFRINHIEYNIGETTLSLLTAHFRISMITNGYTYPSQERFLTNIANREKLNFIVER